MTQKATSKPSKKQVDAVRTVLTGNHPDEYTRAWYVQRALSDVDDALHAAVAGEVVSDAPDGLTRHWLGSLGGSDRGASAHALAEAAAEIKGGRSFVTELLSPVASLIADEAVLMRAIKNLLIGRPFATLFLERGTALARVHAPETAPVLEARAAFAARHAELLADLRPDAQEKKQKLATAKLDTVKGDDRPLLITWLLSEPGIPTDAKRWARLAGFVDPAVEFEWLAYALNDGSGIYDEEEQQLGKLADAAGAPALERATNMLVFAIERTMVTAMEHLAEATPKAFGTERGFSAVETALLSNDARAKRICDDMRVISGVGKAFSNAQARAPRRRAARRRLPEAPARAAARDVLPLPPGCGSRARTRVRARSHIGATQGGDRLRGARRLDGGLRPVDQPHVGRAEQPARPHVFSHRERVQAAPRSHPRGARPTAGRSTPHGSPWVRRCTGIIARARCSTSPSACSHGRCCPTPTPRSSRASSGTP